jgi:Zn-dependent protease
MFGKRITLFKLFGFEVGMDFTWFILAILITWTLAVGVFPKWYPELSTEAHWWMGVAVAIVVFFAIVFHELSHSLIARRYGLPIKGITLFIFGGVAQMEEEPSGPKAEFFMAIAGPIASLILAAVFYGFAALAMSLEWSQAVWGTIRYLFQINLILAVFNLIPAFPLDGGRMLRAGLWARKGDLRRATRQATRIGNGFGLGLIFLGVVNVLVGNFIGGMWWFLIGLFLRNAANLSYQQVVVRRILEGVPVRRIMTKNPVSVPPSLSVSELVDDYFYKHYHKLFPVIEGEKLTGCISVKDVKGKPQERWSEFTVGDIMRSCSAENTVPSDTDAMDVLSLMNRTGNSRLLVTENGRLAGIIALKDMLGFLSIKIDLEGEGLELGSSEFGASYPEN